MAQRKSTSWIDRVRDLGGDVRTAGRNTWLAGLGAVSVATGESRRWFDDLVERGGALEKDKGGKIRKRVDGYSDRAKNLLGTLESGVQGVVTGTLNKAGVPTRDEIRELIDRVETLTSKVETLAESR